MSYIIRILALTLLIAPSLYAANIPADSLGADKYNSMKCVDEASQVCINNSCLNSDQIDCLDNCRTLAQQKCQNQNN